MYTVYPLMKFLQEILKERLGEINEQLMLMHARAHKILFTILHIVWS
jgi:hypothetical protein